MFSLPETSPRIEDESQATGAPQEERPIRRILVATVGTSAGDAALRAARAIAARHGASVEMVTVYEPRIASQAVADGEPRTSPEAAARAGAARLVERVRRRMREALGDTVHWPVRLAYGYPPHTIARVAQETGADLVVLGIGRAQPWERRLGSETGLRIALVGETSVLAVAEGMNHLPRRVLAVLNGPESGLFPACQAAQLMDSPGTLWLARFSPALEEAQWDAASERVEERCRGLSEAPWASSPLELRRVLVPGGSLDEMLALAEGADMDLIAVAVHGKSFDERSVMGDIAAPLFRAARCSVLLTPAALAEGAVDGGEGAWARGKPGARW
jgi:nucleotide-binding universal stress UspA family protein